MIPKEEIIRTMTTFNLKIKSRKIRMTLIYLQSPASKVKINDQITIL